MRNTQETSVTWSKACSILELRERKVMALKRENRSIVLFAEGDQFYAVDNRCPHMGFPLSRGTLKDGVLTCHWHAWQFDASCGGCFTRGGSSVDSFPLEVRGSDIYIGLEDPDLRAEVTRARSELERGLREFSSLRLAKATYSLLTAAISPNELVAAGAQIGCAWGEDFSGGLTVLTATANLVRDLELPIEDRVQALVHGLRNVARDVQKTPPRRYTGPLPGTRVSYDRLTEWFRGFVHDREEDAAERVLSTAIQNETAPRVEAMFHAALADYVFLDEGHMLDFTNKAFELLEHIGWSHAGSVLPALIRELCTGRRHEEDLMWKQPHDLIAETDETLRRIDTATVNTDTTFSRAALVDQILADQPDTVAESLVQAFAAGTPLHEIALAVALAASTRLGRFHTRNEFSDWDWAHHGVTTAAAVRRMSRRTPTRALRTLLVQTAMYVFLARFLNVPKHPLPHERGEPSAGTIADIESGIQLRRPDEIDRAVHAVFQRDNSEALKRFASVALREDLEFHGFQQLEAAVALHRDLAGTAEAYIPLAAAARYLAAHSPTARSVAQTVSNAIMLQRGGSLHE